MEKKSRFDLDGDIRSKSGSDQSLLTTDQSTGIVSTLHSILKPFLLRRLKVDVEKTLPPKKEYLLHAPLTKAQKELYESVVSRTIREFLIAKKTGEAFDGLDDEETKVKVEEEKEEEEDGNKVDSARRSDRLNKGPRKDYGLEDNDDKYFARLEKERNEGELQGLSTDRRSVVEIGREYATSAARTFFSSLLIFVYSVLFLITAGQ